MPRKTRVEFAGAVYHLLDRVLTRMARRLRTETAVSLKWIAENLSMGTWTHVSNRLYHAAQ